jgi:hypothetical protein
MKLLTVPFSTASFHVITFLSTLFSNTLTSSLYARDQVSHQYKTTGKNYAVLYISIFTVLDRRF